MTPKQHSNKNARSTTRMHKSLLRQASHKIYMLVHITTNSSWTVTLSWLQHGYSHPHLWRAILTRKIGHTDLVFHAWSGFISRYVHERLQVSVCSSYDLCHPG